ncbi:MAG: hypothetical protein RL291_446 [Pseudomonadota bacterium]
MPQPPPSEASDHDGFDRGEVVHDALPLFGGGARASEASSAIMSKAQAILEKTFGYKAFRLQQKPIIEALLDGRDVLALMPTGGGKSLCYQIPALVREGTGVVISPLIALMQDQVDTLREVGVRAAFLNSTLSWEEVQAVEWQLVSGNLDLVYIAPERLVQERTMGLLERAKKIALFAIDEAHCVSAWGHDFRPEYRQLKVLAERFPGVPRIALTATADLKTRDDIVEELRLETAETFVASFDRPNIRYTIEDRGGGGARERMLSFIESEHADDAGIIYCMSRRACDETAEWLTRKGRQAIAYHAGMDADARRTAQERFLKEDGLIVVATIAFGMGIDKPDVRFVCHLNLPKSIEAYYQETGRAGRDGEPASAWMAYSVQDIITQRTWIKDGDAPEAIKRVMTQKLDALVGLAEAATCRRQRLLGYFGETLKDPCGNCDTCLNPPASVDGTVLAQKALSAVYKTGQRYGMNYVIDVLTGELNERVDRNQHDKLSVFGIGKDVPASEWQNVFRQLIAAGLLMPDNEGHHTLGFTDATAAFIKEKQSFIVRKSALTSKAKGAKAPRTKSKDGKVAGATVNRELVPIYAALRQLRAKLAAESRLPPYVIFHDKTLVELAEQKPVTLEALSGITGLGDRKVARYGEAIIEVIVPFKAN